MSIKDFLKETLFFSSLTDSHYEELAKISRILRFEKDETIFSEGEEAKGFYIVKSGKVKVFKISFEGKEHILHILGPKEPFGEAPAFTGGKFPAHSCAIVKSEIIFFDREKFISLLKRMPEISLGIIALLSKRLHTFTVMIENLSLKEVPSRLAGYLLYLSEKNRSDSFSLDMPKKFLANFIGTTPETISRVFYKLKDRGIIEMKGGNVRIIDKDTLISLSEGALNLREG